MAERELTIKINAKNLTEAEFAKVRKGLGSLGSASDAVNKKTSTLQRGFSSFGKAAPGALRIVRNAALATGAVIAGLSLLVLKLGQRGTELVGIKDSFQRLTAATGESGEAMISMTQQATKGLITDLQIMQQANKGLLLGLPITSKSMAELSKSAIVLGKAMGLDAKQSLDSLITGLGRSSPLLIDNLGITVKVGKANEAYAKKLNTTVSRLTDAQKKTAFYEATVKLARAEVEKLGGIQLTFGDQIQRGVVFVTNLTDRLSIMIAKSPPLQGGMKAIGEAVVKAFGGNQETLILGIVNVIERAAFSAIKLGQAGLTAASFLTKGFAGIKVLILGVAIAIAEVNKKTVGFVASVLETAAKIPVLGAAYKGAALAARSVADGVSDISASLKLEIQDAAIAAAGNDTLGRSLTTAKSILDEVNTSMVNAGLSTRDMTVAVADGTTKVTNLGTAIGTAKDKLPPLIVVMNEWKVKTEEMGNTVRVFGEDIVVPVFDQTTEAANRFGGSLVIVGGIATAKTAAMRAAFASFGISTRAEMDKTHKEAVKAFELIKASGEKSAKELEEIWAKYEESRREDSEETTAAKLSSDQALMDGSTAILGALGQKYKAAAIAGAIIAMFQAIAKANAAYPWPFSLVPMAAAAAVGAIQISRIKSSEAGFQEGTRGLDFQEFGPGSLAALHGREAVIPQGGGHQLAMEIAGALKGRGRGQDPAELRLVMTEFRADLRAEFSGLSRSLQRAVRDGVLLAK